MSARIDAPFFAVDRDGSVDSGEIASQPDLTSRYETPVTLNVGVGF